MTIGTDATGRVLVDLEAARGPIAVTGPADLVDEALSAMATELATSQWADVMRLTLVGTGADLAVLAPDRVQVVSSVAEALPILDAHAAGVAHALSASGARSVLAGRAEGLIPEAWATRVTNTFQSTRTPEPRRSRPLASAARCGRPMPSVPSQSATSASTASTVSSATPCGQMALASTLGCTPAGWVAR